MLNQLQANGHRVTAAAVGGLSPYTTSHIRRFGDYVLDESPPPDAVRTRLDLDEVDAPDASDP